MANDFDIVKGRSASEKFNLVRITPARCFNDDLTLSFGTTYTATIPVDYLASIEVDGGPYIRITFGLPSQGHYHFDNETKIITINFGVTPTDLVAIAYHHLFFTSGQSRQTYEFPTDSSTPIRRWDARIDVEPNFSQNIRDIQEGILTTGVSNIDLANEDGFFLQYLGENDSWSNAEIIIWLALNRTENVKLLFKGLIKSLRVGRRLEIQFFDQNSVLNRTLYSNGNFLNSTYNKEIFPDLFPSRDNSPIYKLYAETSYYRVIDEVAIGGGVYRLAFDRLLEAICIDFTNVIDLTNNREWGTILNEGDGGVQTDVVTSANHAGGYYSRLGYTPGKKYKIGDTLLIGTEHVRVYFVLEMSNEIDCTYTPTILTGDAITRPGISSVLVSQDSQVYYCLFDRDYTVDYSGNPNDIIKITFTDNFEANVGMPLPLNPNNDVVKFRAWADTGKDLRHGTIVQELLEGQGLTVNAASITAANATDLKTNFYVPFVGSEFNTHTEVLQRLLFSTFGYISLNNDLEFEYHLFETLAPPKEITDDQILVESFNTEISYNDLRDSISPENDHDIIELGFQRTTLYRKKTTYLHKINTNRTYNHILATTVRMEDLFKVIRERRAIYTFTAKTNPDEAIGGQFQVTRDRLIGNTDSRNVILVGLTKKTKEVDFVATDLYGL